MFGLPAGGGVGIAPVAGDIGEIGVVLVNLGQVKGFVDFQPLQQILFGLVQLVHQIVHNAQQGVVF